MAGDLSQMRGMFVLDINTENNFGMFTTNTRKKNTSQKVNAKIYDLKNAHVEVQIQIAE